MIVRIAVLVALATVSARAQIAAPPPMFSAQYREALRGFLTLEEADAAQLEQQLVANPEDFSARLKLIAYHQRADRYSRPEGRAKHKQLVLWLIERHPDSEILHSGFVHFPPGELSGGEYRRVIAWWDAATKSGPRDAALQWNAASFFEPLDTGLHLRYLEATAAAEPNHPYALRPLAHPYARLILQGGPLAETALAGLEASNNVWVLGNAAYMFQSFYNQDLQRGAADPREAARAERYFQKAKALDPNLDRRAILPEIDLQAIAAARQEADRAAREAAARAEQDVRGIRRLPIEAFRQFPPTIAGLLRDRGCSVPQPFPDGARNAIRAEFFASGESGWAVLCSVNYETTLLAFRNDQDRNPDVVFTSADLVHMQSLATGEYGYSREITPVGRDFIMGHYRAYGDPEPPPLDHQGIDDAFLGKASSTWYFFQGQWLRLQGAD